MMKQAALIVICLCSPRPANAAPPDQFDQEASYCSGAMHEAGKNNPDAKAAELAAQTFLNKRIQLGISAPSLLPSAVQGSKDWVTLSDDRSAHSLLSCVTPCATIEDEQQKGQCGAECWKSASPIEREIVFTCLHIDRKIAAQER